MSFRLIFYNSEENFSSPKRKRERENMNSWITMTCNMKEERYVVLFPLVMWKLIRKKVKLYMEHVFPPQQFYGSHNENLMYFSLYLKVRCFLFQCILYISAFLLYGVIGMNECQVYFFFFFLFSSCQI